MIEKKIKLNSGYEMPRIGLGTWEVWSLKEVEKSVIKALECGYRHVDTAEIYENEEGIGKALKSSTLARSEVFLTSKVWTSHCSYKLAKEALYKSLERIQTDYLDLYLIHWPTPGKVETWQALEELKKEGVVKSIGFSNFNVHHVDEVLRYAKVLPAINQVECHPAFLQKELREYSKKHDIKIEAWAPLMKGRFFDNKIVQELAKKHKRTPAQIILNFEVLEGLIVIPKSVHENRIRENFQIFDFKLDTSDIEKIRSLDTGKRSFRDPDDHGFTGATVSVRG